jgi:hypothetical protein
LNLRLLSGGNDRRDGLTAAEEKNFLAHCAQSPKGAVRSKLLPMHHNFSRALAIGALCLAGLLPAKASAATVIVVQGGRYHYHGGYYRYHYGHHYYNHRAWVVSGSGRRYYRYW